MSDLFRELKNKYKELVPVYNFMMSKGSSNDYMHWLILNQENHFWSEQCINLDCQVINEIFEWIMTTVELRRYLCKKKRDPYGIKNVSKYIKNNVEKVKRDQEIEKVNLTNDDISLLKEFNWLDDAEKWTLKAELFATKIGKYLDVD